MWRSSIVLLLALALPGWAQNADTTQTSNAGSEKSSSADSKDDSSSSKPVEEGSSSDHRGAFVGAPLPISSPALGTGLVPVVAYIFPFRKS